MIARRIAERFVQADHEAPHASYFEYLLTKFSTPEEIFGPLSITELKADRFTRNTAGYLPTVKMAFLDEIFKASSSILNALLTILNDRKYHNGARAQDVPMQALIAASNELPVGQEELAALYDRFLLRCFVDYVSQDNLHRLFEQPAAAPEPVTLDDGDLAWVLQASNKVTLPPDIVDAVQRIWLRHKQTFKEDARETLSDRRLKKVIHLLRVSAATNGRDSVDLSDVFLLKDCLWNHPDNAVKVRDLILEVLQKFTRRIIQSDETAPAPKPAIVGAVVRGFLGSGTETDPFLIRDFHDLMGLERPDVGRKGYHFRQTADIDCTELSSWMRIPFQGHYDGGGYTIKYRKVDDWSELFSTIDPQSRITHLKLDNLRLANAAHGSAIAFCSSNVDLIKSKALHCSFFACDAGRMFIIGDATHCVIDRCRSRFVLIAGTAHTCMIRDCAIKMHIVRHTSENLRKLGGIAAAVTHNSVIERCFVTGYVRNYMSGDVYLSGIAGDCEASVIRHCAVGELALEGSHVRLIQRIAGAGGTLEKNASLDLNAGDSDSNGCNGKTVPGALFKQHYFEYTLGWDFDNVWQWNAGDDKPELRPPGADAMPQHVGGKQEQGRIVDLLTQQMAANLWV